MSDLREILFNVSEGFKAIDARLSHIELQHRDISEKLDNIVVALGTFHSDVEAMRDLNAEQLQRFTERLKKLEHDTCHSHQAGKE